MPLNFSPQALLGQFVILNHSPLQLAIVCTQDSLDPTDQCVAITINDTPFEAKPVDFAQLQKVFATLGKM